MAIPLGLRNMIINKNLLKASKVLRAPKMGAKKGGPT